ncbi:MAG TPA: 2,3-epoxybenzoyl-CoA dihydrolase [Casimicrobiaceae bacterium]|nr:2,3-epoxybenzoyl-CoA dihydrolase [Casimicrobiaceae bacterium]
MLQAVTPSGREGAPEQKPFFTYDAHPDRYAHWRLAFEGAVATLTLNVDEDRGLVPGYKLKLNSYDLGVDIELADALQRIRFEHPEVRSVIVTSGKERVFCSGANIFMLGLSAHAWKVNFCKFTNETRNGIEDSSAHSGLKFIAACNGTTAGGGYELALACDEIILIDDRSSTVSLPEVPLLGVLPGTGGLTRLTDKRRVRRDHADMFCTLVEGVRAQRAKEWRLIDAHAKPQQFGETVKRRALELAAKSDRPADARGVALVPLKRAIDADGYHYEHVDVRIDRSARNATITVRAPATRQPDELAAIAELGAAWWPLAMARELDDAILLLRTNEPQLGTWLLKTSGDARLVLDADATLERHRSNWFVRETIGMLRRTLARLDVTSRTLYALIEPGSCFAGTLLELALAADRSYMLALPDDEAKAPRVALSTMSFGAYPMVNELARLAARFYGEADAVERARAATGRALAADEALELGLVTAAPDDLDWADEIRIAIEERASLSPDALTGMEANLRFGVPETMETRIFGRLSAWQNWIFIRPNAVGESGALKTFGSGNKPRFDWGRV